MNIQEKADKLKEYAELEGTELGEYLLALISLAKHINMASDSLEIALEHEIDLSLEYLSKSCKIIEIEETITRKFKQLEWEEDFSDWV